MRHNQGRIMHPNDTNFAETGSFLRSLSAGNQCWRMKELGQRYRRLLSPRDLSKGIPYFCTGEANMFMKTNDRSCKITEKTSDFLCRSDTNFAKKAPFLCFLTVGNG
jgi:hypothetical protein